MNKYNLNGLTTKKAEENRKIYGSNEIKKTKTNTFLSLLIFKIHSHYPGHNQIPTFCPIHRLNLNILKQTFPHTSTIFSFFQHCQIAV